LLILLAPAIGLAKGKKTDSDGTVHVSGYYRKDGTYVHPYTRRAPGTASQSDTPPPDAKTSDSTTSPSQQTPSEYTPDTTDQAPPPKTGEKIEGKVVRVVDGDTLVLLADKTQYKIRLDGIDAPEKDQPFGNQSKKALSDKVYGKTVRMLSRGQDKYGRTLGIIYADGCVNTAMVREGWAWHYKEYSDNKTLAKAEEEARAAKAGLWADAHPIAPWDWRHKPDVRKQAEPVAESESPGQPASEAAPEVKGQETEKKFWMTNSSGKRHNSSCRYYHNSKGHPCGPNDGIPCKICGG